MILKNCNPKSVFYFFEKLSEIPRGSGDEKAVSDYTANWARGKGLKVIQDGFNSVCIFKPGTPGYENRPAVILQGHLDMVCEKNRGTAHDFLKDPLKLRVDGDFISAEGTTLGSDNGIAVAICMALLDADDIAHPPLEVIFTTDEEAGMSGAEGLDTSVFTGKTMINLDTTDEGTFIAGCAGGVRVDYSLSPEWTTPAANAEAYTISVKGLKGGHSGAEINQERANSIRVLGRVLNALKDSGVNFGVASVNGGMKMNAIPREAEAVIAAAPGDVSKIKAVISAFQKTLQKEFRVPDPGLTLECLPGGEITKVITDRDNERLISSLLLLPHGIQAMSGDIPGIVETSANIGVLETDSNKITIRCLPRSSVQSRLNAVKEQYLVLAELTGAKVKFSHEYPAWEYNPDSALYGTVAALFKELSGRDAVITAIHAGLECGILGAKMPGLDIISFGPDAYDAHTPDERLSVSSTERVWKFIIELMKRI